MRLRPLSLDKLAEPIVVEANLLGRIPRTPRESYLYGLPGYLYLGLLMKDDEIDQMPNKDADDFWLHPGYTQSQYAVFIDKLLEKRVKKMELDKTRWRDVYWDDRTRKFRHPTIKLNLNKSN